MHKVRKKHQFSAYCFCIPLPHSFLNFILKLECQLTIGDSSHLGLQTLCNTISYLDHLQICASSKKIVNIGLFLIFHSTPVHFSTHLFYNYNVNSTTKKPHPSALRHFACHSLSLLPYNMKKHKTIVTFTSLLIVFPYPLSIFQHISFFTYNTYLPLKNPQHLILDILQFHSLPALSVNASKQEEIVCFGSLLLLFPSP